MYRRPTLLIIYVEMILLKNPVTQCTFVGPAKEVDLSWSQIKLLNISTK